MEEKKSIKISLSTFFLMIAIVVIIIMGYFIYKVDNEKQSAEKEAENLNGQVGKLENTIDNLQEKIDVISNTINSDKVINNNTNTNNTTNNNTNKNDSSSVNTIKIEGTYNLVDSDALEKVSYTFSKGSVTYEALNSAKGTYEIVDNKIEITYNVAYDPDGNVTDSYPNGQKEELTIVDENTLTTKKIIDGVTYNGKYVKQ